LPKEFIVTPWRIEGEIDYSKLVEQFGTQLVDDDLIERIKKHTKDLHYMLRRKIFFSHRDMDWILDRYEEGEKFFLYTGRGPSGPVHLGHVMPWIFTKYLQDKFDTDLYFQMTDDEKFLYHQDMSLEEAVHYSYENALDVIALGFDQEKTHIFSDVEYAANLYKMAIQVAKRITFSTTKAVFGFNSSTNVGMIFFTSMQAAPAFLPSFKAGRNIPCLIPHAIDQDPHFRVARDVAPKLGYYKPAAIHCSFLPSLAGADKMSASRPETSIYTTDDEASARRKIMNAFTGGAVSAHEQRMHGANPDICPVCQYYFYLFETDDEKLGRIFNECRKGERLCGECKKDLAERVVTFLKEHQRKREEARDRIEQFMLRD